MTSLRQGSGGQARYILCIAEVPRSDPPVASAVHHIVFHTETAADAAYEFYRTRLGADSVYLVEEEAP